MKPARTLFKIASVSLLFLFIAVYAFFTSRNLIFGVKIKNVNIVDGAKVPDSVIVVSGNAKNAIHLTLNGREISLDLGGNFSESMALAEGYNLIDIKAEDKFGYHDEKIYKLIELKNYPNLFRSNNSNNPK